MIRVESRAAKRFYAQHKGAHGRRYIRTAYMDAAWRAFATKYPCECEAEVGAWCGNHKHNPRVKRVLERLVRWLMWRDRIDMERR